MKLKKKEEKEIKSIEDKYINNNEKINLELIKNIKKVSRK